VKRDFDALERRRFQALGLLRQGLNQSEVARRVCVVRQSVARWAALERQSGERALRQAGRAGRKPRLTERQKTVLEQRLLAGPERLGYDTSLWSSERVAHLIEREFSVRYHSGHVWKLLVSLGWSCQRPVGRALDRNAPAIRHWKKLAWPDIKKSAKRRANGRLSRRKRTGPAAARLPHLVAARPHAGAPISL
jgi:transposase